MPDPIVPPPSAPTSMSAAFDVAFPDGHVPQVAPVTPAVPAAPVTPAVPAAPVIPAVPAAPVTPAVPTVPKPADPKPGDPKPPDLKKLSEAELAAAEKAMTPHAGTAFRSVRGDLRIAEAELEKAQAKIKTLEERAPLVNEKEYTQLKEKAERYERELSVVNIEATEEFQTKIARPLELAHSDLKALAKKHDISPATLQSALDEPDSSKRSDLLSELSANFNRLETVKFDGAINAIEQLTMSRQQAKATAAEKLKEAQATRQREADIARKQFEESWKTAKKTSVEKLVADDPVFQPTGDEKWDASLKTAQDNIDSLDMGKLSNDDLADRLYKSEVHDLLCNLISDLHGKNKTQAERIQQLEGTAPVFTNGSPPPAEPIGPTITERTTFAEIANQELPKILGR